MYCGLCLLTFGLCAITGSQARLALSVAFWVLLNHKASSLSIPADDLVCLDKTLHCDDSVLTHLAHAHLPSIYNSTCSAGGRCGCL